MPYRVEADLHVHTLLSACAQVEMIPSLIVRKAERKGLDVIAITDHNSAENAQAVIEAAKDSSVKVLPGIEAWSREDVHVVCVFDNMTEALALQEELYAHLPQAWGHHSFRDQMIVDADGEFLGYNEHLCSVPTSLNLDEIVEKVESLSGLAIPSHVDRSVMSLISALGFVPEDLKVPALEISRATTLERALEKFPSIRGRTIVLSSDAHCLENIGAARTVFYIENRSAAEIKLACENADGRYVEARRSGG